MPTMAAATSSTITNGGSWQSDPDDNHPRCEPESRNTRYGHLDPPSRFDDSLPVLNSLVVQGLGSEFCQLNAAHIRVSDVGEDRFRIARVGITNRHTAIPEPRDSLCRVLDLESVMSKTSGPLSGCRVEFEKCVL